MNAIWVWEVCVCSSSRHKRPHLTRSSPLLNCHPLEFDEEDEDEDGAVFLSGFD